MSRPKILGIVNITSDSFSDGGKFLTPEHAIQHASALHATGADIIDLGPAASHPHSTSVSAHEECQRLEPVIAALQRTNIPISIDSFLPQTQRYGIASHIDYLNDVFGFPDAALYPELAHAHCKLIVMHSIQRTAIADKRVTDPERIVDTVLKFFDMRIQALTAAGISPERLILDPGMGFFLGSNPEPSLCILENLPLLRQTFQLPVLISVSRKSFIRNLVDCEIGDSGSATLAAELYATLKGVDYIRTHDVKALRDGLKIWDALL